MKLGFLIGVTLMLGMATAAAAQEVPLLHDVTGVAQDDTLNIRENPRSSARRIGELASDATAVEVVEVSDTGDWGRVNSGEGSGWVAMKYLAPRPGLADGQTYFDGPLICSGTEPFWALERGTEAGVRLSRADSEDIAFADVTAWRSANLGPFAQAMVGLAEGARITATLRRGACGDGMSSRAYALTLDLVLESDQDPQVYSGCCSLSGF